jgi:hypothetical protein
MIADPVIAEQLRKLYAGPKAVRCIDRVWADDSGVRVARVRRGRGGACVRAELLSACQELGCAFSLLLDGRLTS